MTKIYPNFEDFKNQANINTTKAEIQTVIPIWSELISDIESPITIFYKICNNDDYSFLLESADGGENFGRYSILGCNPLYIIKAEKDTVTLFNMVNGKKTSLGSDPYEALKNFTNKFTLADNPLSFFSGGLVGYFNYDTVRFVEPTLKPFYNDIEKCESFPDAVFMVSDTNVVFDHVKHKIYVVNNVFIDNNKDLEIIYKNATKKINEIINKIETPQLATALKLKDSDTIAKVESNISKDKWKDIVDKTIEYIKAGDIFQAVLSQRFKIEKPDIDNFMIYRALRSLNPSPYMYYLQLKDFQIIGASPEMLVKCDNNRIVKTCPIAGTRKRGKTEQQDHKLAEELINDPKERAEHIMLVDLGRNDLGRVCEYGSISMSKFMEIEKYSHVMHIVSEVTGKLKDSIHILDLLKACFPAGTLSGAPKVRAMEIIYDLEHTARGPYGGCIAYIGFNNELNTCITIRTLLLKDNDLFVQAGAGIVADSIAANEYLECQNKANALIQTINLLTP